MCLFLISNTTNLQIYVFHAKSYTYHLLYKVQTLLHQLNKTEFLFYNVLNKKLL